MVAAMWTVVAVIIFLGTAILLAQTPAAGHHDDAAEQVRPPAGVATGGQNMPDQKAMMARMAAADQKLDRLIEQMNAAKGEQKVDAIAAVVTELAAQRRQMCEEMMRMQTQMQSGMGEQMKSHMPAMAPGGTMKKTPDTVPGAADGDHAAHHPEK
jgi:hypothetical protein